MEAEKKETAEAEQKAGAEAEEKAEVALRTTS
jgi:hypothetical protein